MAKVTVTIEVCDYPKCNNDKGLAPCLKCGVVVCATHRFEGIRGGSAVFLCWIDSPVEMG